MDTQSNNLRPAPMPLVEWNEELSIGIQEIDDQHQLMISLLNKLHAAIHQQRGQAATQAILTELVDYTKIHFAVEESLMRILGFPGYEAHKRQHDRLIVEAGVLQEKLATGKKSVGYELLHFLRLWLTRHIMHEDQQYGPFFLQKGAIATFDAAGGVNGRRTLAGRLWSSFFR